MIALDIPEAAKTVCPRRNPKVTGDDRATLAIVGGAGRRARRRQPVIFA